MCVREILCDKAHMKDLMRGGNGKGDKWKGTKACLLIWESVKKEELAS